MIIVYYLIHTFKQAKMLHLKSSKDNFLDQKTAFSVEHRKLFTNSAEIQEWSRPAQKVNYVVHKINPARANLAVSTIFFIQF